MVSRAVDTISQNHEDDKLELILTMRQSREKLLGISLALGLSIGEAKASGVPPEDVVAVFKAFPLVLGEQVAEGGVSQCDGLRAGTSANGQRECYAN